MRNLLAAGGQRIRKLEKQLAALSQRSARPRRKGRLCSGDRQVELREIRARGGGEYLLGRRIDHVESRGARDELPADEQAEIGSGEGLQLRIHGRALNLA